MIVELLITACLIGTPDKCKDVSLLAPEEEINELQCFQRAPVAVAAWNDSNPKYYIKKWGCHKKIEEKI